MALGALATMLLVPACVVTSEPTYQPPEDCPPYYVLNSGLAPTTINHVVLSDTVAEFKVSLVLGSCATDKTFGVKPFIDGEPGDIVNIPPNDGTDTRNFEVTLHFTTVGCHAVELVASANYTAISSSTVPNLPREVAYVRFFVGVQSTGDLGPPLTLADCVTP